MRRRAARPERTGGRLAGARVAGGDRDGEHEVRARRALVAGGRGHRTPLHCACEQRARLRRRRGVERHRAQVRDLRAGRAVRDGVLLAGRRAAAQQVHQLVAEDLQARRLRPAAPQQPSWRAWGSPGAGAGHKQRWQPPSTWRAQGRAAQHLERDRPAMVLLQLARARVQLLQRARHDAALLAGAADHRVGLAAACRMAGPRGQSARARSPARRVAGTPQHSTRAPVEPYAKMQTR